MLFSNQYLNSMSKDQWQKAAKMGANYLLEMAPELNEKIPLNGCTCMQIGLMIGSEGKTLLRQNWMDDIFIKQFEITPIRYSKINDNTILNARDLDTFCSEVSNKITKSCVDYGIFESNFKDCIPLSPLQETLGKIALNGIKMLIMNN